MLYDLQLPRGYQPGPIWGLFKYRFGGCTEERRSWTLPLFFHYIRPETGTPFGLSTPLRSFRLPPAGRFPKERDGKNPVHYQWQNYGMRDVARNEGRSYLTALFASSLIVSWLPHIVHSLQFAMIMLCGHPLKGPVKSTFGSYFTSYPGFYYC